ncbi:hypothetical protein P5V15_004061 [Pogonomyrmex californicus]
MDGRRRPLLLATVKRSRLPLPIRDESHPQIPDNKKKIKKREYKKSAHCSRDVFFLLVRKGTGIHDTRNENACAKSCTKVESSKELARESRERYMIHPVSSLIRGSERRVRRRMASRARILSRILSALYTVIRPGKDDPHFPLSSLSLSLSFSFSLPIVHDR